ncbi:MAG TPA: ribosome small subunit-dependent GTPase A [Anaerolineales bacterium]|nr:ribosome small subunit-dependent GTPase A [Anaerolineales bacterium]
MPQSTTLRGLIVRSQSGFFTVQTGQGVYVCRLRGRLKKGPRLGDVAALGDRVEITPLASKRGVIEAIEERQRMLVRLAPTPSGEYQQVIIANPDQAVFIFACSHPAPRFGMLDRFLVIAEKQAIPAVIVANKLDLVTPSEAGQLFAHYASLDYPLVYTSTKNGAGLDELRQFLSGKISVFAGPSGVGKSSLLNLLLPGLNLKARAVSQATTKGRHTTVVREMYPLEEGGYVADTPGLKAFALWDIEPEELDGYFPELRDLVAHCQFSDCTHLHEPGCAVTQAVESGGVHPERYASYVRMRLGQEEGA